MYTDHELLAGSCQCFLMINLFGVVLSIFADGNKWTLSLISDNIW